MLTFGEYGLYVVEARDVYSRDELTYSQDKTGGTAFVDGNIPSWYNSVYVSGSVSINTGSIIRTVGYENSYVTLTIPSYVKRTDGILIPVIGICDNPSWNDKFWSKYNTYYKTYNYDCMYFYINDSIEYIGANAFSSIKTYILSKIPKTIQQIGDSAFTNVKGTVVFEAGGKNILFGEKVFTKSGVTSVVLPHRLKEIPAETFKDCLSLESITVNDLLESIGESAFSGCTELVDVNISDESKLSTIDAYAFKNCSKLKGFTAPKIESIDKYAFLNCSTMTIVPVSDCLKTLGEGVFSGCIKINELTIPESVCSFGKNIFSGCSRLKSVRVNGEIYENEFYGAESIEKIIITDNIEGIGKNAFNGAIKLESILFEKKGSIKTSLTKGVKENAFSGCYEIEWEGCDELLGWTSNPFLGSLDYEKDRICDAAEETVYPLISELYGTLIYGRIYSKNSSYKEELECIKRKGKDTFLLHENELAGYIFVGYATEDSVKLIQNDGEDIADYLDRIVVYNDGDSIPWVDGAYNRLYAVQRPIKGEITIDYGVVDNNEHQMGKYTFWYNKSVYWSDDGSIVTYENGKKYRISRKTGFRIAGLSLSSDLSTQDLMYDRFTGITNNSDTIYKDDCGYRPWKDYQNKFYDLITCDDFKITLYAIWEPIQYRVVFMDNGIKFGETLLKYDESIMPPDGGESVRYGYKIVGYDTDESAVNVIYDVTKPICNLVDYNYCWYHYENEEKVDNAINLYAVWKPISYQIHFEPNGGKGKMTNQELVYGKKGICVQIRFQSRVIFLKDGRLVVQLQT